MASLCDASCSDSKVLTGENMKQSGSDKSGKVMTSVFISLGTNIERDFHLRAGVNAIKAKFENVQLSSVYESEPVGFLGEPFYNMVIACDTQQSLSEIAALLRDIEYTYGRPKQAKKFSSRRLDLDILLFDDIVCTKPVQLPREEICFNAFVLWPLAEIAPELEHPVIKKTFHAMWQSFDKSTQKLRKIPFNL